MSGSLEEELHKYRLFDRTVRLRLYQASGDDLFFFTMHDNETTSVRAGRELLRKRGGELLELTHDGQRCISFHAGNKAYRFDPNRMFSDVGARASLQDSSSSDTVPDEVVGAVREFATFVVDRFRLAERRVLHTLHNVTDELSITSYREGGEFSHNATRVIQGTRGTEADFFLVTDLAMGQSLAERGWNVVVQDNDRVEEDGSLSVWARDRSVPYVNVEARQGHVNTQKEMIRALYRGDVKGVRDRINA